MRRLRTRTGPSASDLIRQTRVRKLLCRYGAYSRDVVKSSAEYSSSAVSASRSSYKAAACSSSALQFCSSELASASRSCKALHDESDLKLSAKQCVAIPRDQSGNMDKGLALAAAQYVANTLSAGDINSVDAQKLKEDFLHQLNQDWGFASPENLGLGRIRITIKRRDNDAEVMRRKAELEKVELERKRLEELSLRQQRAQQISSAVSQVKSSQQVSSSTTKVVKTRVVKTVKRTVQTVRTA